MAILNFQKPDKVILIESSDYQGRFEFRPLEPGYGLTVGNALRRVLLSSLEGFAITSGRIEGLDHEFTTIPGVVEDVTEMVLNLKQISFKRGELIYLAIFLEDLSVLPPKPKTLPDILRIGNITLPLNLSIFFSSLTIVSPVFSKKFNL